MRRIAVIAVCLGLLSGCSWQSLNPLNWFGDRKQQVAVVRPAVVVEDGSVLIDQVLSARAERTTAGVIVHVTGQSALQGGYGPALRPVFRADGTFSHLEFRVFLPEGAGPGQPGSNVILVGGFLNAGQAASLGSVTVTAARNSLNVPLR